MRDWDGGSGFSARGNYFTADITVSGGNGTVTGGGTITAVTPYVGGISGLINAFKRSSQFQSLMTCAWQGVGSPGDPAPGCIVPGMMSYASTAGVAQFGLAGCGFGCPWALLPKTSMAHASKVTESFKRVNTPYLLRRDIDPASNDNSPVWLNKTT